MGRGPCLERVLGGQRLLGGRAARPAFLAPLGIEEKETRGAGGAGRGTRAAAGWLACPCV